MTSINDHYGYPNGLPTHASSHQSGGGDPVTLAQSQITNLTTDLAAKAPLASPALTGNPTAPTPTTGDNDTSIATTAFVNAEIAADAAPISHVGSGGTAHADAVAGGAAGFMSGADKTKLDGIAAGAEVNVNADWNAVSGDAQILNKPSTFAPSSHASSHQSGGSDAIKLDDLAAPDDNTDLNATVSAHGLLPKLGGGTTNFLRADGTWAAPSAAAGVYWAKITSGTDVAITGATSATLNRMHVVSGTSADYTITISGLSPTAGDVLGFYVKDYAAASKQFKLDAGGTVKIAGRTRYLVLTHANVVLLMWDGTDWQPLVLCLDSPTVDLGAVTITGSSSNPAKGTIVVDKFLWSRVGDSMRMSYKFQQSTTGSNGSGYYTLPVPLGTLASATDWNGTDSHLAAATKHSLGRGRLCHIGTTNAEADVVRKSSTTLGIVGTNGPGTTEYIWGSTAFNLGGIASLGVYFDIITPITDW